MLERNNKAGASPRNSAHEQVLQKVALVPVGQHLYLDHMVAEPMLMILFTIVNQSYNPSMDKTNIHHEYYYCWYSDSYRKAFEYWS